MSLLPVGVPPRGNQKHGEGPLCPCSTVDSILRTDTEQLCQWVSLELPSVWHRSQEEDRSIPLGTAAEKEPPTLERAEVSSCGRIGCQECARRWGCWPVWLWE